MTATIEDLIRAIVREELRALGDGAAVAVYTRGNLPPGYRSPEAFACECRRLGLQRDGGRWSVPADVWEDARRRARQSPPPSPPADPVDGMLARSGLRLPAARR